MKLEAKFNSLKKVVLLLVILNSALLIGGGIYLAVRKGGPPPPKMTSIDILKKELNLKPEQISDIQKIESNSYAVQLEFEKEMRIAKDKVNSVIFTNAPDSNVVVKLIQEVADLEYEKEWAKFNKFIQIKNILTPNQYLKMVDLISKIEAKTNPKPIGNHHQPE